MALASLSLMLTKYRALVRRGSCCESLLDCQVGFDIRVDNNVPIGLMKYCDAPVGVRGPRAICSLSMCDMPMPQLRAFPDPFAQHREYGCVQTELLCSPKNRLA